MATHRREKNITAANVLFSIEQTGCELIKQCGIAAKLAELHPDFPEIPRTVLMQVIERSAALHALLLRYVTLPDTNGSQPKAKAAPTAETIT